MLGISKISPLARAIGTIGAVAAIAGGATFAVAGGLTATASLTGNTMASATAELLISNGTGTPNSNTAPGFTMSGIVPGGPASGPHTFTLSNTGQVDLGVTVYATPSTVTGTLDNNKVHFCFTKVTGGPSTACYTRTEMLANFNTLPGGSLPALSGNIQYDLNVNMDAGAVTGGSASVGSFDLIFTGTQV